MSVITRRSMETVCAAIAEIMGITPPDKAAAASPELCAFAAEKLGGKKADRVFMYNPDAVAEWLYHKYPHLVKEAVDNTELELPLCTVMPSVTPVCFGTMYTGAQPEVHGIKKYEKPIIRIETLFDAVIKAGKKPVIIADDKCSIGKIFLEREMDYILCSSLDEVNARAAEEIIKDEHDLVVVYNGNYDALMHKYGPESVEALSELRTNSHVFASFCELIKTNWASHNTLVGFAMDHGCHEIDGCCGSHGLDMEEDLFVSHLYNAFPAK